MRKSLTAKFIASLKATGSQFEVWDTDVRGFGIRVNSGGAKVYVVRYWDGKKSPRIDIGAVTPELTLADARDEARKIKLAPKGGVSPSDERKADKHAGTFGALLDHYVEHHAKTEKKTWPQDVSRIEKYLRPRWGDLKPWQVTRDEVQDLVNTIKSKAPVQARRVRSLISRIFNHAIPLRAFNRNIAFNPCLGLAKMKKEQPREVTLTDDQLRVLWTGTESAPLSVRAYLRLRLLTLQRGEELLQMQPSHIKGQWWTMPSSCTKTGRSHRVWLSKPALQEIALLLDRREKFAKKHDDDDTRKDFLFPARRRQSRLPYWRSVGKAVREFGVEAGVSGLQGKDLRRTGGTALVSYRLCDQAMVGRILNHADRSVTGQHYNMYEYDLEKKEAMELWAKKLASIFKAKTRRAA